MRTAIRTVAAFLLVAVCLPGGQVAMADAPKATVKSVSGTVFSTSNTKPIPALVYVNGKSVFANKTTGVFTLVGNPLVPPLLVGQTLSLRVLATGYAPLVKVLTVTSAQLTSGKFSGLKIGMKPVVPGKPLTVAATFKEGLEDDSFVVNGTVKSGTTPVCAVVWANGSAMLACQTGAIGKFSLKGKLSTTGKVALRVFPVSSTYRTYAYTTPDTDKDGTANFMDRDDDNDGKEDSLDECPIDPNPTCKLTPTFEGVSSYRALSVKYDPSIPRTYSFTVDLDAFDSLNKIPAQLTGLTSTNGGNYSAPNNPNLVLGTQNYALQSLNCTGPTGRASYDAMMLFDRSGSMSSNDPNDKSREAGQVFVDNLGNTDRAQIAQFEGRNGTVDYLSAMTSDRSNLTSGIRSLRGFETSTPLWDAMFDGLQNFSSSSSRRAMLTFSDGEDSGSTSASRGSVESSALGKGISVFAVNLRNSNSYQLDSIAQATGGNIFNTNDAQELVNYYGVLGQILANRSITCKSQVKVSFSPATNIGPVGYGPGLFQKPTIVFDARAGSHDGQVKAKITLPLYPGRKTASTPSGVPVYESDFVDTEEWSGNECIEAKESLTNNCSNFSVYVRACAGINCIGGLLSPGQSIPGPAGRYSFTSCLWEDDDNSYNKFLPTILTGSFPNQVIRIWDSQGTGFNCSFAGRFITI